VRRPLESIARRSSDELLLKVSSLMQVLDEPISSTKTTTTASSSHMGLSKASHSATAVSFSSLFDRSLTWFLPAYIVVRCVLVFVADADAVVAVWLDVVADVGIPGTSFPAFSLFKSISHSVIFNR
jgi:hypothetical protein